MIRFKNIVPKINPQDLENLITEITAKNTVQKFLKLLNISPKTLPTDVQISGFTEVNISEKGKIIESTREAVFKDEIEINSDEYLIYLGLKYNACKIRDFSVSIFVNEFFVTRISLSDKTNVIPSSYAYSEEDILNIKNKKLDKDSVFLSKLRENNRIYEFYPNNNTNYCALGNTEQLLGGIFYLPEVFFGNSTVKLIASIKYRDNFSAEHFTYKVDKVDLYPTSVKTTIIKYF